MLTLVARTLLSGTAASLATTSAIAVLAWAEGRHPIQPVNSTSHWIMGDQAGRSRRLDLRHTIAGYATHHAASIFWAALFEAVQRYRPNTSPFGNAVAVSALAALVDYGMVPKRLTPGWEKVVTPRPIAMAYVVMALALAATCSPPKRRDRK